MNNHEIIALWGSYQELADAIGISRDRVRKWNERGNIPAEYWADMLASARLRRIPLTAEQLVAAAARQDAA